MVQQAKAHTFSISDIHLSDGEPVHQKRPLWKRYKRPKYFVDQQIESLLSYLRATVSGPKELILNGDVFDFDSVMRFPEKEMRVSWIERKRGLFAEEPKSLFKIQAILNDHPVFVNALREWVRDQGTVIFVIGNHDIELHWRAVQKALMDAICGDQSALRKQIRFCEWFYISERDTLFEHGNQYDAYSTCSNPIDPLIRKRGKKYVRLPFGNLANRYIMNGIGLMNPHVESSFIKDSAFDYLIFFFKYVVRVQPLLVWTWLWGAITTLIYSIDEGFRPALRNPLEVDSRVLEISRKSKARPRVVRGLRAIHVHPAFFNPLKIMRELWLDRAFLVLLILLGAFWFFSTVNLFSNVSWIWFWLPLLVLIPPFIFYARSVQSDIYKVQHAAERKIPLAGKIARVDRVIQGHTHREKHVYLRNVEYINTGNWSPAFDDPECTIPYGRKCFAWVRPTEDSLRRVAELYEWKNGECVLIPMSPRSEA